MSEPVDSGLRWTRVRGAEWVTGDTNDTCHVCEPGNESAVAWMKAPTKEMLPSAMYAMAMERLAYKLGAEHLGLPIPPVYLEEFEGRHGCISRRAGGPQALPYCWVNSRGSMMNATITNEDVWPLAVAFDLWIANVDRASRHVILDPVPPSLDPKKTLTSTSWLIDHEKAGLWWPRKIDPTFEGLDVERLDLEIVKTGEIDPSQSTFLRNLMPARYRDSFEKLPAEKRAPVLATVRGITDDEIRSAVSEVPVAYMPEKAKTLTVTFLAARRDRLDTLTHGVFPLP